MAACLHNKEREKTEKNRSEQKTQQDHKAGCLCSEGSKCAAVSEHSCKGI